MDATRWAGTAIAALLAAGCSGPGDVAVTIDAADAVGTAAEQLAGTFRYTVTFEALPADDTCGLLEADGLCLSPTQVRLSGGVGADGSAQLRVALGDTDPLFDLRILVGDALETLRAGDPAEVTATAAVDVEALVTLFVHAFSGFAGPTLGDDEVRVQVREGMDGLRDEIESLPLDVQRVATAVLDGAAGGFTGPIDPAVLDVDPARFASDLGLLALDDVRGLDVDDLTRRVLDATSTNAVPGTPSVFTVDLDTAALADLLADVTGSGTMIPLDADPVLADVATLTFDDRGALTEARLHILPLVHQLRLQDQWDPGGDPEDPGRAWDVVFSLTDHGEVRTVLDETATTTGWGWLIESYLDRHPSQAAIDRVHASLRGLGVRLEQSDGSDVSLDDVTDMIPDDLHVDLGWSTADGQFCLSGYGTGADPTGTHHWDTTTREVRMGPCGLEPESAPVGDPDDASRR